MLNVLDVIDTAVKIGLGAVISALTTYWHSKQNSKAESRKEYEKRYRTLLEQVAEQVETLNHVYLKYWSIIVEWVRLRDMGIPWSTNDYDELEIVKKDLYNSFGSLTSAESKLLLIGENKAYLKLRELGDSIVSFRRSYFIEKNSINENDINIEKEKIKILREEFFYLRACAPTAFDFGKTLKYPVLTRDY